MQNKKIRPRVCASLLLGGLAGIGFTSPGQAQQWQFEPVVRATVEYEDNPRLRDEDSVTVDEAEGAAVDLLARIVRRTPTGQIRFDPRIRSTRYTDADSEEVDDLFFQFLAETTRQVSDFGISVRAARQAVLTAEVADPDFDNPDVPDPVSDDSGLITLQDDRDRLIVTPYFNYRLSERTELGTQLSFQTVDYDRNVNGNVDFDALDFDAELLFRVGNNTSLGFAALWSDYESDNGRNESNTLGGELLLSHNFSETMNARLAVGVSDIESDFTDPGFPTESFSDTATTYAATLTRSGQISRLVLDVRQQVNAGGGGNLQKREQARLRFTRSLSERVSAGVDVRFQNTQGVFLDGRQTDRDFFRVRPNLEWQLSPTWSVVASYSYRKQDFEQQTGSASSNGISLGFQYEPRRRRR